MPTPPRIARPTVSRMVRSSPACAPHAMLADVMSGMSCMSVPAPSPRSLLRSIDARIARTLTRALTQLPRRGVTGSSIRAVVEAIGIAIGQRRRRYRREIEVDELDPLGWEESGPHPVHGRGVEAHDRELRQR